MAQSVSMKEPPDCVGRNIHTAFRQFIPQLPYGHMGHPADAGHDEVFMRLQQGFTVTAHPVRFERAGFAIMLHPFRRAGRCHVEAFANRTGGLP